jgi:hypothetical protein
VESLISHTEKVYYFIVNYTKETIQKMLERDYDESVQNWFSGGSTRFDDREHLERYSLEEI